MNINFEQRSKLTVHIALAIVVYIVSTTILCRKFGDNTYDEVKGLHKLAGFFVLLAAIGAALVGSDEEVILALSFQRLAPLIQHPIVAALIIWSYIAFIRFRRESN